MPVQLGHGDADPANAGQEHQPERDAGPPEVVQHPGQARHGRGFLLRSCGLGHQGCRVKGRLSIMKLLIP